MRRLQVLPPYHGEGRSVWHVADTDAPDDAQPAIVASFHSPAAARDFVARGGRDPEVTHRLHSDTDE